MTNRYELIGKISWEASAIQTAPITPARINPLLDQLYDRLKGYVFKGRTIKATLIDVDDFWTDGFTPLRCTGGYGIIKFDVIDEDESDGVRCENYNNYIRAALIRELQSPKFLLNHYRTSLWITNVSLP